MWSYQFSRSGLNEGKVGKLDVKGTSHWEKVNRQHWIDSDMPLRRITNSYGYSREFLGTHCIHQGLVRLQHELVVAADPIDNSVNLVGDLYHTFYDNKDHRVKGYFRCPYHPDLLPNWEQFAEGVKSNSLCDLEEFRINNVMLPTSPFFSTKIMPILTANITTITSLELESCDLKPADVDSISTFVKKNRVLAILNLSKNALFGDENDFNGAAKNLAKAVKNHPNLSLVNLGKTGLGKDNDGLKILLEGCKKLNSLIIDDNNTDRLDIITSFFKKKNDITVLSMASMGIGKGDNAKSNTKLLKQCLEKNATLEQLCLGSNSFGSSDRVLSTVLSGIKSSALLTYLDLSGNEIRRMPSVKLLAKYLSSKSQTLIELNLNNNSIPGKPAIIIMQALKKNTTLEHLSLRRNNITDQSVPAIIDLLKNNTTLRSFDLFNNNFKVKGGRKTLLNALCDPTSLDSIANNSNHACSLTIVGRNYGGTHETELTKMNTLKNEGQTIRYKVVFAMCKLNKELYNPRIFDDVPLELMPKLLELVQQEVGCKGFGKGIVDSVKKRNTINRLDRLYETIHQWPSFPLLFSRGPGKKKRKSAKRKRKADDEEDWTPHNRDAGW